MDHEFIKNQIQPMIFLLTPGMTEAMGITKKK
jgi:hypothetical protein